MMSRQHAIKPAVGERIVQCMHEAYGDPPLFAAEALSVGTCLQSRENMLCTLVAMLRQRALWTSLRSKVAASLCNHGQERTRGSVSVA